LLRVAILGADFVGDLPRTRSLPLSARTNAGCARY